MLAGIYSVHGLQNTVAARLNRKMKMRHDLFAVSHRLYKLIGAILGMRGHKSYDKISVKGVKPSPAAAQSLWDFQDFSVGVDILAEQGNFLISVLYHLPRLVYDGLGIAAAFPAPDIGHNTVGAEIVAAVHYRQPAFNARSSCGNILGNNSAARNVKNTRLFESTS